MSETSRPPVAPIPRGWRDAVRHILHARAWNRITVTIRAQHEWDMTFPCGYPWDLFDALEKTVARTDLVGRRIPDLRPPGEAYEFFFEHDGKTLYGKVNLLLPERKTVIVVSAHPPYKGKDL